MYDEILQAVIDMAQDIAKVPIFVGSTPPYNGLAMIGQGGPNTTFLDVGTVEDMTITLNGKNADQNTIIRQLDLIHHWLTKRKDFPGGDGWHIYSIETIQSGRRLGTESGQILYGSTLRVKFYTKGI